MKTTKPVTLITLLAIMSQSALPLATAADTAQMADPSQSLQSGGDHTGSGNGGGDPAVAYIDKDLQGVQLNFNLDYLKLTPKEIKKRDKKLKVVYDYYKEATVGKVVSALEDAFGLNVYHYQITEDYKPSLKDKKHTMDAIIRYYMDFELSRTPFEKVADGLIPFKGTITKENESVPSHRIAGNKKHFAESTAYNLPFLIYTAEASRRDYNHYLGLIDANYSGLYSSMASPLYEIPTLDTFLAAMKASDLKGLDASVVFLSNPSVENPPAYKCEGYYGNKSTECHQEWGKSVAAAKQHTYKVIYPQNSKLAPIPQPVIFIGRDASSADIQQMLNDHAPRIYAYNKLFEMQMLPDLQEFTAELAKYPHLYEEVKRAKGHVKYENFKSAAYETFLVVNFSLIAAAMTPVALAAMLTSAVLSPLFLSTIVVVVP